jgi:hypothetical protein
LKRVARMRRICPRASQPAASRSDEPETHRWHGHFRVKRRDSIGAPLAHTLAIRCNSWMCSLVTAEPDLDSSHRCFQFDGPHSRQAAAAAAAAHHICCSSAGESKHRKGDVQRQAASSASTSCIPHTCEKRPQSRGGGGQNRHVHRRPPHSHSSSQPTMFGSHRKSTPDRKYNQHQSTPIGAGSPSQSTPPTHPREQLGGWVGGGGGGGQPRLIVNSPGAW